MSVAQILQAMAENAGRRELAKGALIGNTIAGAAQVPAQIVEDRTKDALLKRQQAMQDEQLGFARNADARATSDQSMQEHAAYLATAKGAALKAAIAAGFSDSTDPKDFNEAKAIKVATDAGFPDLAPTISETHKGLLPKLTSGAPGSVMRDETGQVVPGSEIPDKKKYTPRQVLLDGQPADVGFEEGSAKYFKDGEDVTGRVSPYVAPATTATHNMRLKGVGDVPVDYVPNKDGSGGKWLYQGKDVSGDVTAIPPVSVQVNQAAAASAGQPASAAERAIANYMLPPISPRSMQTPAGKAMMDRILAENPSYDASKYSNRAPTRKAFTTGTQGQQITAMNTAIEHLDQLQAAADALKNGDFKPGNSAYNSLKETFGANAPTNYETIKNMVDKEVEAVANKGVPTVAGTAAQQALAGKSASPDQIKGYIDTLIPLMGSKVNALTYQYKQAMGENDPYDPVTPQAKAILEKRAAAKSATPDEAIKVGGFTVKVKK